MSDNTTWNGYPPNPEVLGWHWIGLPPVAFVMLNAEGVEMTDDIKDFLKKLPILWIPEQNAWLLNGDESFTPTQVIADNKKLNAVGGGFTYLGSCL